MTGFGKASGRIASSKVSVEIRALNSKSLDLNVRIAPNYKESEAEIRKVVAQLLERGKIDLTISAESDGVESPNTINVNLAKNYYAQIKNLDFVLNVKTEDYVAHILRMPEIFNTVKNELSDEDRKLIIDLVASACDDLNQFRKKEGQELVNEYTERLNEIRTSLNDVVQYEQERIDTIKDRIRKGLEEITVGEYDENRLEQEMIFYIEKLDISEEKMRLGNHLDYFEETMKLHASGKKLGFISQEIGREINTLGSKSNHAEMQKLVIGMKDNLEKIKEQILNTL